MNGESDILIGETIDGAYFSDPVNVFANYSPTSRNACMALTDPVWVDAYNMATNNVDAAKRAEGYSIMQNFVVDTHRLINVCERVRMLVWNSDVISEFPLGNPSNPTCLDVVFAY